MAREKRVKGVVKAIEVLLAVLTVLAFAKSIWISLDMDESYAVALGYRMARGDMLVRDMWEPHQFSGFLAALFTGPYLLFRGGNTDYLVIYLRIVGALIHMGLGLALYRLLRKRFHGFFAFGMMILHLNYLPKWVQMPEFELMHYWCLLGIFLLLYTCFTSGKLIGRKARLVRMALFFGAGCLLTVSMMCYPTMVILYPFYALGIYLSERQYGECEGSEKSRLRIFLESSGVFTLGAFLAGAGLLAYLLSYMSPEEFSRYISYIFMDTSHGVYSMGEKWARYFEQILGHGAEYASCLALSAGIVLLFAFLFRLGSLVRPGSAEKTWKCIEGQACRKRAIAGMGILVLLLAAMLLQVGAVYGCLFQDQNQFYLQGRYGAIILPGLILGICCYKKMALWLHLCLLPGIMSVVAVLFVTNMSVNVTYAKAFLGVLGSLAILEQYRSEAVKTTSQKRIMQAVNYALAATALAAMLVCRLVLIRVSGCGPVTIRASLTQMERGPEKGVYVLADTAHIWNDNYGELEKYVEIGEKVLYIGAESLTYVCLEADLATPSCLGTAVYNEMFLHYYEEHPEKVPDVVVYDKTFGENPAYALSWGFSVQNPVFFQWIEENYREAQKVETEHLIILKK